jgi:23S rRNA pseudouridine955/2504/2580 synthase
VRVNKGRARPTPQVERRRRAAAAGAAVRGRRQGEKPARARIPVLFEDEHLLAIDKPAGVAVMAAAA